VKGLTTLKDLPVSKIQEIIDTALLFKKGELKADYSGKKMALLFFENSTRTEYSFCTAMLNLGISPIYFNDRGSSIAKGETLYDTVKTFESFGIDGVVIRHSKDEYFRDLENIQIPIFNGGDGCSNHPTQTLLDLMTIYEEFGRFEGLKVTFVGDIAHSRVAHGNNEIMRRLGMETYISGPEQFADGTAPYISFEKAIEISDVINLLRIQFERHTGKLDMTKEEYFERFGMTKKREAQMKDNAIIIHPAPVNRGIEIADDMVEGKKSRIFKQINNGVYIRMAVISMVLEGKL